MCPVIDFLTECYEKHVLLRDFNMEPSDRLLAEFLDVNSYYNLEKESCFNLNRQTRERIAKSCDCVLSLILSYKKLSKRSISKSYLNFGIFYY